MCVVRNRVQVKRDVNQQINIAIMQESIIDGNSIVHGETESQLQNSSAGTARATEL